MRRVLGARSDNCFLIMKWFDQNRRIYSKTSLVANRALFPKSVTPRGTNEYNLAVLRNPSIYRGGIWEIFKQMVPLSHISLHTNTPCSVKRR